MLHFFFNCIAFAYIYYKNRQRTFIFQWWQSKHFIFVADRISTKCRGCKAVTAGKFALYVFCNVEAFVVSLWCPVLSLFSLSVCIRWIPLLILYYYYYSNIVLFYGYFPRDVWTQKHGFGNSLTWVPAQNFHLVGSERMSKLWWWKTNLDHYWNALFWLNRWNQGLLFPIWRYFTCKEDRI